MRLTPKASSDTLYPDTTAGRVLDAELRCWCVTEDIVQPPTESLRGMLRGNRVHTSTQQQTGTAAAPRSMDADSPEAQSGFKVDHSQKHNLYKILSWRITVKVQIDQT